MGKTGVATLAIICLGILSLAPLTVAQDDMGQRPALQQAISDRYHVTIVGATPWKLHTNENQIKRAGGVVVIRKAGLYGALDRSKLATWAMREGKPPELLTGDKDQEIKVGEKFYVNAVYIGSDVVSLGLLSVATIPTAKKTGQIWMSLAFFLPKDVLQRGDITPIYQAIDPWLLPEGSFQPGYVERAPAMAGAPAPPPVPAAPADLKPGMDREQVIATLGAPSKEASFGTKTWLTYPGMVVVLEQGKLASVDQTSQPPAKVSVASDPAGADVYVDGNFVGSTPSLLPLPPGSYKIEVKASGYKSWSREIKALPGGEVSLKATLEK